MQSEDLPEDTIEQIREKINSFNADFCHLKLREAALKMEFDEIQKQKKQGDAVLYDLYQKLQDMIFDKNRIRNSFRIRLSNNDTQRLLKSRPAAS